MLAARGRASTGTGGVVDPLRQRAEPGPLPGEGHPDRPSWRRDCPSRSAPMTFGTRTHRS